jgi:sigma-B regulation protein RsbU (phosphoserine phosphatase)
MARRLTHGQMQALLEASVLLNSTLEVSELLRRILDSARRLSGADRSTLYLLDEARDTVWTQSISGPRIESFRMPVGVGIAGRVIQTGRSSRLRDAYRSPHFHRERDRKTGYRTRSMLTVPFHGREGGVLGAIQAINHLQRGSFDERDEIILRRLGDYAALALENARYVAALREKRRMEEELIAAQRVQNNLLPHELPRLPGVDLAAVYVPCLAVGGDCYDALVLPDGQLGVALGDIAGKGLTAAMMMANLQALFRVEARRGSAPHEVVAAMSRLFYESTEAHQFATFFYGILDAATGRLRTCSAGHEPLILIRADGTQDEAPLGGPLLGIFPDLSYVTTEVALEVGDLCAVYSDGITEQFDASGAFYGRDRLVDVLRSARDRSAAELVDAVCASVRRFAGETPAADDLTLLVLRRTR